MGKVQTLRGAIFAALVIAVMTGPSAVGPPANAAEWMKVGGTHKFDRYVDMTTIGTTENKATIWTLRNFRGERAIPSGVYRSMKTKRQYDCRVQKRRPLHVRYYHEAMAQGRVLYAAQATREWSRVIPGSDDEAEMKIACRGYVKSQP